MICTTQNLYFTLHSTETSTNRIKTEISGVHSEPFDTLEPQKKGVTDTRVQVLLRRPFWFEFSTGPTLVLTL